MCLEAAVTCFSAVARGGMTGLAWPGFMSGTNSAPKKPVEGSITYHSIRGIMTVTGACVLTSRSSHQRRVSRQSSHVACVHWCDDKVC